jgi:hypothetical protein
MHTRHDALGSDPLGSDLAGRPSIWYCCVRRRDSEGGMQEARAMLIFYTMHLL